jgi:hypothetical protein
VPPEYLIEGVLQRRFIYSLTGQTGHAKTALALPLAILVGTPGTDVMLGNHQIEHGQVVYFAGENPDDVRMRLIGMRVDREATRISIIPGVFDIDALFDRLADELKRLGTVDLIIIDTSVAYFLGDDELSNTQMGDHARMLRKLTEMPGGPCVLVLCHPIKHVKEPTQLLPRGGGAFLAEMDGNLTAWRPDDNLVELHHNKIRGPGFEPMTFRIERITTTELMDSKGRLIPTVKVVLVSEHEEAAQKQKTRNEEDQLLAAVAENPDYSMAELALACGWVWQTGEPAKSKVERVLKRLKTEKLVKSSRGRWVLTSDGKKARGKGSNADASRDAFQPIKGKRVQGVGCVHCGKAYGAVFKIRNGRVKKGKGEALHEACAEAWFSGDSAKKEQDG